MRKSIRHKWVKSNVLFRQMPCVIYKGKGKTSYYEAFPRNKDGTVSYYMLPPIKYSDGKMRSIQQEICYCLMADYQILDDSDWLLNQTIT